MVQWPAVIYGLGITCPLGGPQAPKAPHILHWAGPDLPPATTDPINWGLLIVCTQWGTAPRGKGGHDAAPPPAHLYTLEKKQQELWILAPMWDPSVSILGALGMLSSPCCLITGITFIPQNCQGLGFRGEKAACLPPAEACAGRRDRGGRGGSGREAEGLSQAPELCIPHLRVYSRISAASRLNVYCLGGLISFLGKV